MKSSAKATHSKDRKDNTDRATEQTNLMDINSVTKKHVEFVVITDCDESKDKPNETTENEQTKL